MANNLQITRVEQARDGKGTGIYFTFAYPITADNLDGYVVLDNATYLAAMQSGTIDDPNAGLYKAVMENIFNDIYTYLDKDTLSVLDDGQLDNTATDTTPESSSDTTTSEVATSEATSEATTSESSSGDVSEYSGNVTSEATSETTDTESEAE